MLTVVTVPATVSGDSVREVSFTIWREPDGKKYANPVKESYTLSKDGRLRYSAYFGGMPTNWNSMDGVDGWKSGAAGKRVLDVVLRLAKDMPVLPDDSPVPEPGAGGVYLVGLTRRAGDFTRVLKDAKSKAWGEVHAAFLAMVAAFEKETGRPRRADQLPQR